MRTQWRRRLAVVAGVVVATVGVPAASRASSPATDFVLVQLVAGSDGASGVNIEVTGTVAQTQSGTLVVGAGFGADLGGYTGGDVTAADVASTGVTVGTSSERGGVNVAVGSPVGLVYQFSSAATLWSPPLEAGDRFDLVVFFPNGEILSSQPTVNVGFGTVETTVTMGSGSRTLDVAAAGDGGTAVAVGGFASGTNTHHATTSTGIVGTIIAENCNACTGTWAAPDGRSGSWSVPSRSPVPGMVTYYQFGGPAGDWAWTWTGSQSQLHESSADYGAYAPIGPDWVLFRSGVSA